MQKLVAVNSFPFAGRSFKPKDELEASDVDADILVKIGHAKYLTRSLTGGAEKQKASRAAAPALVTKG